MSKVTLEDVACQCDYSDQAALVRAAARVVEAARRYRAEYPPHLKDCTCSLCASLAAFDQLSKGEP